MWLPRFESKSFLGGAYLFNALFSSTDDQGKTAKARYFFPFLPQSLPTEVNYHAGTDAQVVLVIVDAIVEGSGEVVGFDQTHREALVDAQVEAAAQVGGKGRAGVGGGRTLAFDQASAGVRKAHQHLAEGLHRRLGQLEAITGSHRIGAQGKVIAGAGDRARMGGGNVAHQGKMPFRLERPGKGGAAA